MWEAAKFVDGLRALEEFHQRYSENRGPLGNAHKGPRAYGGDTDITLRSTTVFGNNGGRFLVVSKELC